MESKVQIEGPTEGDEGVGDRRSSDVGHNSNDNKCQQCHKVFSRSDSLARHVLTQHSENLKVHQCPICKAVSNRLDHLRSHVKSVHKKDPTRVFNRRFPKLLDKSEVFDRRETLKESPYSPVMRYVCNYEGCGLQVSRKQRLSYHIKQIHNADPSEVMGETFWSPNPNRPHRYILAKELNDSGREMWGETPVTRLTTLRSTSRRKRLISSSSNALQQPNGSSIMHDAVADLDCNDDTTLFDTEEGSEDKTMCILCCSYFYLENEDKLGHVSESYQFIKFVSELLEDVDGPPSDILRSLKNLSVCSDCFSLIDAAMDRKMAVDEVEITVNQIQLEILGKLRVLQRKLNQNSDFTKDSIMNANEIEADLNNLQLLLLREMKFLQARLHEYTEEMWEIESVVSGADKVALKSLLRKNALEEEMKQSNSIVLHVRNGVGVVAGKLERWSAVLGKKFGATLKNSTLSHDTDMTQKEDILVASDVDENSLLGQQQEGITTSAKVTEIEIYDDKNREAESSRCQDTNCSQFPMAILSFDSPNHLTTDTIKASSPKCNFQANNNDMCLSINTDSMDTSTGVAVAERICSLNGEDGLEYETIEDLEVPCKFVRMSKEKNENVLKEMDNDNESSVADPKYEAIRSADTCDTLHSQSANHAVDDIHVHPEENYNPDCSNLQFKVSDTDTCEKIEPSPKNQLANETAADPIPENLSPPKSQKNYDCIIDSDSVLRSHRTTYRANGKSQDSPKCYQCPYCRKRFTQLANLKNHQKMHFGNGERNLCLCSKCGQLFLGITNLFRHQQKCSCCLSRDPDTPRKSH